MSQRSDGLGFLLEVFDLLTTQVSMHNLDGRLLIEPHMLPEVDLSIATLSQQADQPVIAKLLSKTVCHPGPPNVQSEATISAKVDR